MKVKYAILIGIVIWAVAASLFTLSFSIPILENPEQQANMVLFIVIMPLVWMGCKFYYKKDKTTHGFLVGQTLLLTAIALDVIITVPFIIIPSGGSYYSFFTSLGFWIVAVEFIAVAVLYWYAMVYSKSFTTAQK